MNELPYTDTAIIDCSRSSASVKQDDNPAEWINQLNDTIQLEPGDRVSMYSSFINERGAGQAQSVELRGEAINFKTFKYTKIVEAGTTTKNFAFEMGIPQNFQREPDQPFTTQFENVEENIMTKDNEVNLIISYYKTMDTLSYIQLPRRFIPNFAEVQAPSDTEKNWAVFDAPEYGAVLKSPIPTTYTYGGTTYNSDVNNTYGYIKDDYKPIYTEINPPLVAALGVNSNINQPINNWVLKNDNTRYTILVRKKTQHSIEKKFIEKNVGDLVGPETSVIVDRDFMLPYYSRDPEASDYIPYRKKITLKLDKGFNSSSFIAEELTKQLAKTNVNPTNVVKNTLGDEYRFSGGGAVEYQTQINYPISKSAESETYNQFPATSDRSHDSFRYNQALNNHVSQGFGWDINDPSTWECALEPDPNLAGAYRVKDRPEYASTTYYEALQYIACKRPEIYEAGSAVNDIFGLELAKPFGTVDNGLDEAHFQNILTGGLITNLDYNEANCKLLKDFIESQAKYPELFSQENIINMYQDDGTAFQEGPPVVPSTSGETTNPYFKIIRTFNDFAGLADDLTTFTEDITMNATVNNSRFFHMNSAINKATNGIINLDTERYYSNDYSLYAQLGCSYYDWRGTSGNVGAATFNTALDTKRHSLPFLVHYDPLQKDIFYYIDDRTVDGKVIPANPPQTDNDGDIPSALGKFTYGFMGAKSGVFQEGVLKDKIVIFPNKIVRTDGVTGAGLPTELFIGGDIEYQRKLGFDRHFNAWGTCCVALTSGISSLSKFRTEFSEATIGAGIAGPEAIKPSYQGDANLTNFNVPLAKTYLGADKMTIGYDGQHFFFSDLHTALNKGNLANSEAGGLSGDGGLLCYKINPEQHYNNYSPVQFPYEQPHEVKYISDTAAASDRNITRVNQNITPWAVYDTTTGIFIEDFGYDESLWDTCLWKKLGFSYAQLHDSTTNRFTRYSNFPSGVSKPTTNAKIDAVDTKEWNQNQFFDPLFDGSLAHSKTIKLKVGEAATDVFNYRMLPQITITGIESIKILATDYPITSFKGYYTIRSDIISSNSYKGHLGDTAMDVIGICDKIYPVNDFITGSTTPIHFTVTAPRTLASVKTAVTDPDGKYSIVNGNSSILYKVERFRTLNLNVAADVMKELKNKQ